VLRAFSTLSAAAMIAGVAGLYAYGALFASHWALRLVQVAMAAVMVSAVTWYRRRRNADAAPELITSGPFAYLRHPLYAALIHFVWAGATDHFSWPVLGWAETVTAGAFTRMHVEEYRLKRIYPEYRDYKKRVKKLIPFVY
jgi:protein-S-isoprenylcysteine O-methyltransferase Ste14